MGLFSRNQTGSSFDWTPLTSEAEVDVAIEKSAEQPVLLFKHSTRCSISSMALSRFEKQWDANSDCTCYFLDLIAYRSVSNYISDKTAVVHQSPQCILLWKEKVIYDASHNGIDAVEIASLLNNIATNE